MVIKKPRFSSDNAEPTSGTKCFPSSALLTWITGTPQVPSSEGKGTDGFFRDGKEEQGVGAEVWVQRAGSGRSGLITAL